MARGVLVAVLLIAGYVAWTEACSCLRSHPQDTICRADFVMQVRLRSEAEIVYRKSERINADNETIVTRYPISKKYNVKIRKVYKIKENSMGINESSTVAVLTTPFEGATCGVDLYMRTNYLVSGFIYDRDLSISLCGINQPWPHVSKMQRKYLRRTYLDNCDCSIAYKSDYNLQSADKTCYYRRGPTTDCYHRNTACIKDKNSTTGSCKWHRNRSIKQCKQASKQPIMEP